MAKEGFVSGVGKVSAPTSLPVIPIIQYNGLAADTNATIRPVKVQPSSRHFCKDGAERSDQKQASYGEILCSGFKKVKQGKAPYLRYCDSNNNSTDRCLIPEEAATGSSENKPQENEEKLANNCCRSNSDLLSLPQPTCAVRSSTSGNINGKDHCTAPQQTGRSFRRHSWIWWDEILNYISSITLYTVISTHYHGLVGIKCILYSVIFFCTLGRILWIHLIFCSWYLVTRFHMLL